MICWLSIQMALLLLCLCNFSNLPTLFCIWFEVVNERSSETPSWVWVGSRWMCMWAVVPYKPPCDFMVASKEQAAEVLQRLSGWSDRDIGLFLVRNGSQATRRIHIQLSTPFHGSLDLFVLHFKSAGVGWSRSQFLTTYWCSIPRVISMSLMHAFTVPYTRWTSLDSSSDWQWYS